MRYFQLMALTVSTIALMSAAHAGSAGISSNNSVGVKASATGVKANTKANAGLGLKTNDDYSVQEGENEMGEGTYDSSAAASADTGYSSNASIDNSAAATVAGSANNTVHGTVNGASNLATDLNNGLNTSAGSLLGGSTKAKAKAKANANVGAKANGSLLGR